MFGNQSQVVPHHNLTIIKKVLDKSLMRLKNILIMNGLLELLPLMIKKKLD